MGEVITWTIVLTLTLLWTVVVLAIVVGWLWRGPWR